METQTETDVTIQRKQSCREEAQISQKARSNSLTCSKGISLSSAERPKKFASTFKQTLSSKDIVTFRTLDKCPLLSISKNDGRTKFPNNYLNKICFFFLGNYIKNQFMSTTISFRGANAPSPPTGLLKTETEYKILHRVKSVE